MTPKRPKVEPIRNPTLFDMDKLDRRAARQLAQSGAALQRTRPAARHQRVYRKRVGGGVLPSGHEATAISFPYYAKQFRTVEIDSTYYGTPSASTVTSWYEKTPPDFVFAAKVPQVVTHEKVLKDCEAEFDEFIDRMGLLGEKLGPLLLQFRWFNKYEIQADEFFLRLRFFLQRLKDLPTIRFVVEIRNRAWLDKRLTDLLREYNVALALTDISRMPRPWEKKQFDWVTTDFVYVRWLGDRKGMETLTTTWDKTIINRTDDLQNWAELFRQFVSRNLKIYAYANNHYAGHGPDTVKLFWDMWEKK